MKALKSVLSVILCLSIVAGVFAFYTVNSGAAQSMIGDANADGAINSFDALVIIRHSTGYEQLKDSQLKVADVDGDGDVDSTDALFVLQYSVGIIGSFPVSAGSTDRVKVLGDFWYDPVSGKVTNSDGSGLLGFSYSVDEKCFYASLNSWQRNFGYTELYDQAAPVIICWYDTTRIFFNYDGKEWMIQLWKGQYGWVLVGCEIGLYFRDYSDTSRLVDSQGRKYYKCADNELLIKMSLSLYRNNKLVFSRKQQYSWWLTGFYPGMLNNWGFTFDSPKDLLIDARLTFTDEDMMDAFIGGLEKVTEIEHNATKRKRDFKFEYGKNYTVDRATHSVAFQWQ